MNQSVSLSVSLQQISPEQTSDFDYSALDTVTYMAVQQYTSEIKALMRRSAQDVIELGQKLIEVKQHLGHGNFRKWLKSEFNWSISTATKFMQVGEQFKCVNFTHLKITASALYLLAAPSTPPEARAEALENARCGENMTYTKAKDIVLRYKKVVLSNLDKTDIVDVAVQSANSESFQSLKPMQHQASDTCFAPEVLATEVETQTYLLSTEDSNQQIAISSKRDKDELDDTIETSASMLNQATITDNTLDALTIEIANRISNWTPEQLALVINKCVNDVLSDEDLELVITQAQQALQQRQQLRNSMS
ncbi:hypothetical protein BZZ01_10300 [Nostocales cyanobacterium HT-58-2]|nr:hypothetical protein BZZ01_10300 [Nostocales cyanobacterium HT-58-2]